MSVSLVSVETYGGKRRCFSPLCPMLVHKFMTPTKNKQFYDPKSLPPLSAKMNIHCSKANIHCLKTKESANMSQIWRPPSTWMSLIYAPQGAENTAVSKNETTSKRQPVCQRKLHYQIKRITILLSSQHMRSYV